MRLHLSFRVWRIRWCHYITSVTSWGVLVYFNAGDYVSFNHHRHLRWAELEPNDCNTLFSQILGWFDLAVTLIWPCHGLGVTLLWSPTPTHVTMCTWVGNIWSSGHWSEHDNRWVNYLVHFCDMRKGWHKGHLIGDYPFSRYITPVTSWVFWLYFHAGV